MPGAAAFAGFVPVVATVEELFTGVVVPAVWLDPQPVMLKASITPTVSTHTQKRMRIILITFDRTIERQAWPAHDL